MDLAEQRAEYSREPLKIEAFSSCPFAQFELWYGQARSAGVVEPNALSLATVDSDGSPTQRTVLLKHFDKNGLTFFTNLQSRKSQHLQTNSAVSLLFQWLPIHRQLEVNGQAEKITKAEAVRYFLTRPVGSQLGAWVSDQSAIIESRAALMQKFREIKEKFRNRSIPVPSSWGGFRVVPHRFEFWQGGADRLHDRIEYTKDTDSQWTRRRLSP